VLLSNKAMFDFSSITAESDHIIILKSKQVSAGAIVKSTNIELKTLNRSDESSLSHIIESLNNINLTKPQITKVGDQIVKYFVPTLILIGLFTIIIWYINTRNLELAITYGLTVIVVACPCAI
jgi:cation transport ATPase